MCIYLFSLFDLPFNIWLLLCYFSTTWKEYFELREFLIGWKFVLLLYLWGKWRYGMFHLHKKCRMATVKPISRKTFPKSVRLSFEVTTKRGEMSETILYPLLEPVCKHWQLLSLQDELEKIMRCPSISVFLDYQYFFYQDTAFLYTL